MPTPVKYLLVFFCAILALIVGLIVLIQTQVTPDKIRDNLIPLAQKALQREIAFGDIEIGLLSGVTLSDLVVKQKDGENDFISVQRLTLHYRLWSLLQGKVEIDQIALQSPRIAMTRNPNGRFDGEDLIRAGESRPRENGKRQGRAAMSVSVTDVPLKLLVKKVSVRDGQVLYTDRYLNARSPYRYQIEKLNLEARDITLDKPFPIDASAVLEGAQVDISGHYAIEANSGDLIVRSAPINLVPFGPYFRNLIPFKLGAARLATNIEVDIRPQRISSKGKLDFTDLDLSLIEKPQLNFIDARLTTDYSVSFDSATKSFDILTLLLDFNGVRLGVEGRVDLKPDDPVLSATVTLEQLDLRKIMQIAPVDLVRDYQKYSLAGLVDGRFRLDGPVREGEGLLQDALLSLQDVQVSVRNIRAGISGALDFRERIVTGQNLRLKYGGLEATLNLTIDDPFGAAPAAEFLVKAGQLDFNRLTGRQTKSGTSPSSATQNGQAEAVKDLQTAATSELGPLDIAATANGRIEADQIVYRNLQLDRFSSEVSLADNRLEFRNIRASIDKGGISADSVIDLGVRGLAYRGTMNIVQPDVSSFIRGLFPETKQSVSGQMSWVNSFSGTGTDMERILERLQVRGQFSLAQGVVKGTPVLNSLAAFLGQPDLNLLSFKSFQGKYNLKNGVVALLGDMNSSKLELKPEGTVTTSGRVDVKLNTRLSPELLSRLGTGRGLNRAITDDSGWGVLPLEVGGTLEHPEIGLDEHALKTLSLHKAKEKAAEKLLEKIPEGGRGQEEPIRKMLDDTLKKLFGN